MIEQKSISLSVIDPVCGMNVIPRDAAGKHQYQGENYYFCSPGCAAEFRDNPDRYLKPKEPAPPAGGQVEYTCPMHPQIRQLGPGTCPICGMALEPREASGEEINPELVDMMRRLWVSVALSLPILLLMVSSLI